VGQAAQDHRLQRTTDIASRRDRSLDFLPVAGKTHDARAFKETGAADILKGAGGGFGDKGYPGTGPVTPKKKPKGGGLTLSDKEYNSQISSFRAPVERLVAHFKNWKIFRTGYRRPYSTCHDAFGAARSLFFFSITWGFE
jgi:DDE superfamily endonuclease